MDWQEYIHSDPDVMLGKPIVKGTRLTVEFIVGLFANGWTQDQIFENYPTLTTDALKAIFTFIAESMYEEDFYSLPIRSD